MQTAEVITTDPEYEILDAPTPSENGKHKRTWEQREEDLLTTARLLFEKKSHREIAEYISSIRPYTISRRQVGLDVKTLDKRFYDRHLNILPVLQARELEFLSQLEAEAVAAWLRSKEEFQSTKQVGVLDKSGKPTGNIEVTKYKEISAGNPAFLAILVRVSEARSKLTGIIAPTKIDAVVSTPQTTSEIEALRAAYRNRIAMDVAKNQNRLPAGQPAAPAPVVDVPVDAVQKPA